MGGKWANALYKKFKPKEFDQVKVFFLFNGPPQQLFGKKPFSTWRI